MYTAEIISKEQIKDFIRITVKYSDGDPKNDIVIPYDASFGLTPEVIEGKVKQKLEVLNNLQAELDAHAIGEVVVTPKVPTVEEQEAADFFADLETLRHLKRGVDLGIIDADSKTITDVQARLRANIKPEYINSL